MVEEPQTMEKAVAELTTLINSTVDRTRETVEDIGRYLVKQHPEWGNAKEVEENIHTFGEAIGGTIKSMAKPLVGWLLAAQVNADTATQGKPNKQGR